MPRPSLEELRAKYGGPDGGVIHDKEFRKVAERLSTGATRPMRA